MGTARCSLQAALVQHIKDALVLPRLMVAPPQLTLDQHLDVSDSNRASPEERFQTVAVCAGSGSSLLDAALAAKADVFITGAYSLIVPTLYVIGISMCTFANCAFLFS